MDQLSKDRQRFVLSELSSCSQWKYKKQRNNDDDDHVPRAVLAARRVIHRYDKEKQRNNDKLEREYSRKYGAIKREIYFGSMTKALKMVDTLKKDCGE
jgi:hypothetical protein